MDYILEQKLPSGDWRKLQCLSGPNEVRVRKLAPGEVINYRSPNGGTISLSEKQVAELRLLEIWPKDGMGAEYCEISHGLHPGEHEKDSDIGL